jgi:putative transport protein
MPEVIDNLFQWCLEVLRLRPTLMLFLILGLGYLIGNLRFGGFSFGSVAGVLFAGLFFGHFGMSITTGAQDVGFALFIFSVGYQAGPRFFSAIKQDGLKYFALSVVVTTSAVLIAIIAANLLDLEPGVAAGLLAGGLTSSPTLAAAQDAVRGGTVALPAGWAADDIVGNVATAYAITYIFGLTGLITLLKYMPRILGLNIEEDAKLLEQKHSQDIQPSNVSTRSYQVTNEEFTRQPLRELRERYCQRAPVLTVLREGQAVETKQDTHLQLGDIVELVAPRETFTGGLHNIGPEIPLDADIKLTQDTAQVVVTNKAVLGKTLGELTIPQSFGVLVLSVTQAGMRLPHDYQLKLQKGDILAVSGPASKIDLFGKYVGQVERDISETDMVTFAFGIAGGVVLGMLSITVGGIALGLGNAGGLLAAGLGIGYLRSVRPTFGRLPEAARWVLMEFGLLLFMTGVGLRAGADIIETLQHSGLALIIAGIFVTIIPICVAYLFGSQVLKLNPAILLGALTGAMTSGASLSVVTAEAKSHVPAIGYAGTYAFGNVLLMIAGPLLILVG